MNKLRLSAIFAAVIVVLSSALGGCAVSDCTGGTANSSYSRDSDTVDSDNHSPGSDNSDNSCSDNSDNSCSDNSDNSCSDNSDNSGTDNSGNSGNSGNFGSQGNSSDSSGSQENSSGSSGSSDSSNTLTSANNSGSSDNPANSSVSGPASSDSSDNSSQPSTTPPQSDTIQTPAPATSSTPAPKTDPPVTQTKAPATTTVKTTAATTKKPSGSTEVKPSAPYIITPTADGKTVYQNDKALIDASNSSAGYIMVRLKSAQQGTFKIVVEVANPSVKYTFQLNSSGSYEVIPLTEGSGKYTVYVLQQTSAGKGAVLFKQQINVNISDSLKPFLTPNQFCMYDADSACVALSSKLCGGKSELEKVEAIYDYVIDNIAYVSTAENGANGYVPYPDRTLSNKSGICFDYSSLITAMLRSQKIPTKVVVGYAGDIYHAWISVYVENKGWIDGIISFDGKKWNRMDPTFAAGAGSEAAYKQMIEYISDSSNYTDMYYY